MTLKHFLSYSLIHYSISYICRKTGNTDFFPVYVYHGHKCILNGRNFNKPMLLKLLY